MHSFEIIACTNDVLSTIRGVVDFQVPASGRTYLGSYIQMRCLGISWGLESMPDVSCYLYAYCMRIVLYDWFGTVLRAFCHFFNCSSHITEMIFLLLGLSEITCFAKLGCLWWFCLQNGCPVDSSPCLRENLLEEAVNNMTSKSCIWGIVGKNASLTILHLLYFLSF